MFHIRVATWRGRPISACSPRNIAQSPCTLTFLLYAKTSAFSIASSTMATSVAAIVKEAQEAPMDWPGVALAYGLRSLCWIVSGLIVSSDGTRDMNRYVLTASCRAGGCCGAKGMRRGRWTRRACGCGSPAVPLLASARWLVRAHARQAGRPDGHTRGVQTVLMVGWHGWLWGGVVCPTPFFVAAGRTTTPPETISRPCFSR